MEYPFTAEVLGTHLKITIDSSSSPEEDFLSIFHLCQDFDQRYSRFRKDNYLFSLNENRWGELDDDAFRMLSFALSLAKLSDGYFDPTIAPILEKNGYGENSTSCNYWHQFVSIHEKILTLENGVRIEFGGVGKGYLLEKITNILAQKYTRFLIDFGGDISVIGMWIVWLENPFDTTEAIGTIEVNDGYFCASSGAKRRIGNFHHLVDPKVWFSASEVAGAFVESASGMAADAYATLLCVCPLVKSQELLHSWAIEWVIVSAKWEIFRSRGSTARLFE